ncbi:MAG TPA: GAF domain-containing protein [Chloroflexi bacterium]|nr:GAF domain-containing protein [Chloroflexota bacterium]
MNETINHQSPANAKPRAAHRPTIGLFIESVADPQGYLSAMWQGIVETCQQRDVNLICFAGGSLGRSSRKDAERQRNIAYDLAAPDHISGLIIRGSLGSTVPAEEFARFYGRYQAIPIVSISLTMPDIPGVLIDNYGGMRNLITHLTQVHGHRRIAFIRGPENNAEAKDRYRAYTDVLTEYGLAIEPDLVTCGDFTTASGAEAIRLWLDERHVEFEAVVAANDNMAIGAIETLHQRGIRVPHDVVVAGFDDIERGTTITPSLTTVRQPMTEAGKRATETLLTLLAGAGVPQQVTVPTRLIVRESCGCLSPTTTQATIGAITPASGPLETALAAQREDILFEMVHGARTSTTNITTWAEQLLDAFSAQWQQWQEKKESEQSPHTFLSALDHILRLTASENNDLWAWQGAISALRRCVLPYLSTDDAWVPVEDLWQQSRVLIGERAQRLEMHRRLQTIQQTQTLRQVGQALITVPDMDHLNQVVIQELPHLGIPSCYVSVYQERQRQSSVRTARLIAGYDDRGRIELPPDDQEFLAQQLTPAGLLPEDRSFTMIVEPLYFKDTPLGFAVFEVGTHQGEIYEALRSHLSSALQSALLVQELEDRTRMLQEVNYALQRRAIHLETSAEVARAITSIFDVDILFRKAVNLIRDRFGFYHAGIFLLDETGEWAVLREATGEAGAQMKAQEHRLAVSETSMVGWTAFNREPRITLYAEEDAVRFANPLLPHTRSEMTLPMMIGERLLGVLNVQSTEEAAFDEDDVRALQSMANQVAVAIENARQVSDETRLLEAASPIYRLSRDLAQVTTVEAVADAIINSVAETGADGCTVVEFELSRSGDPVALLYRGVWRRNREVQFQPGMRLPIEESPFPLEMISTLWTAADVERDELLPASAREVFMKTGVQALANIPLHVRNQIIGQVVVLRNTSGPFSEVAMRLYEALSDQAAVALERAQLWEEAQRRAEHEQLIGEISDHMQRAADIESLLRIAATGLNKALGGSRAFVRLRTELDGTCLTSQRGNGAE